MHTNYNVKIDMKALRLLKGLVYGVGTYKVGMALGIPLYQTY